MSNEPTTFLATFKPIQSAVRLDGQGDGGEMVLTFDRSQMAAVLEAWALYGGRVMRVTCEGPGMVSGRKQ